MAVLAARGYVDTSAVDAALHLSARLAVPRAPPQGLVLMCNQLMALSEGNCTPHRALATVFSAPVVVDSMASYLREHVEPEIGAAFARDDPWPTFEAALSQAAAKLGRLE